MPTDILTTAQAAKLLGISVRTAQLLIEGGTLTSWKTPGGHRRVYRADVEALVAGPDPAPAASSALVVVVAPPDRLAGYEEALRGVGECLADGHDDVHAAAVAIGARRPAAVVVDLEDGDPERTALLRSLTANPALAGTRFLAVGRAGLASLRQLPDAVREMLRDQAPPPGTGDPAPPYPLAANENQRLAALDRCGLAQSPPEEAFDRLTWLAGRCLNAPVALLTLLTPTRQVFKSRQGLDMTETPRSWAFCNRTILQKGVFAVENLALDPEFRANPAVAGGPAFRFYAGAPVVDADGFALGSLCVIDHVPRILDEEQRRCLLTLAALASAEVQRRALDTLNRRPGRAAGR
ncbi:excisionase family DNA-binding protein [Inquilinus sp. Marseille-Q2685]|uniref:excisionase family DNA-binding protein n=1 Tax=Inquilinus sp. Marseille-Q2685 TaxID=2866581 RepID=UPI001CE3E0CE|nr:excisionase family DNA-binding protein [Inquilinus sp. Marseille-Q2685]